MKTILVTGGAGFIGSHLCEALLNSDNKVICLDNMFTGTYENIRDLLSNPHFEYVNADVIYPIQLQVDEIYNLACPASPVHYQYDPIMTMKTSFLGALNALELAKKCGAKILQASTSEIYGDPLVHPQTEDYRGNVSTIGPRACYDEGKRVAETLFFDYKRLYKVDTYGPRMMENDGRVVSNFIIQALHNKPITIYGDGNHSRSFCYVDDLVRGMIAVMKKDNFSGPVNLGNPHEMTILELAKLVIRLTGSKSKIVFRDLPEDDPSRRRPDIGYARQEIGWAPLVDIEQGIQRTIEFYREKY